MRDLIEWFLQKRDRSSPDVFQPGYIKVSTPKISLAFRHAMASVEHEGLHDPPRAEPDTELTIKRDRTPVLATSDNVVAPFSLYHKEMGS